MLKILSCGPGRTHIAVMGDFDAALAARRRETFENLAQTAVGEVTLNLKKTRFLDSIGAAAIVYLYKRLKMRGVSLLIAGAGGQPLETLRALQIERAIPVNPTPAAAEQASAAYAVHAGA